MTNISISKDDLKKIVPGFVMGAVRAFISHPFEMLKLKAQTNQTNEFYKNLFRGVHYSIFTNALERGIQFGLYEKFKLNDGNIMSSAKASVISTCLSLPYNIVLIRNIIMGSSVNVGKTILYKSLGLEYTRNLSGSIIFLSSYNYLKDMDVPVYIRAPLASSLVWITTYPVDSYKNMIISNQKVSFSPSRLYKGIQYPLIRSLPSSVVGFYVYEYTLKLME